MSNTWLHWLDVELEPLCIIFNNHMGGVMVYAIMKLTNIQISHSIVRHLNFLLSLSEPITQVLSADMMTRESQDL